MMTQAKENSNADERRQHQSPIRRTAILINPAAGGGRSRRLWSRVERDILAQLPADALVLKKEQAGPLTAQIRELASSQGINCFIAAGGDGSVHELLNALLSFAEPDGPNYYLGGIGLGSSNDFHKPYGRRINGIPVRMGMKHTVTADVGVVRFRSLSGEWVKRYFIINGSLGVTAAANHFFNTGGGLMAILKSRWTAAAIWYAAIRTILTFQPCSAELKFDQQYHKAIMLSNLAVVKNPHISGTLRYDQDIRPDDGRLGLNYCDGMSRMELLSTLNDLERGRFTGSAKRFSQFIQELEVQVPAPVPLEADGEIYLGTDFTFSLLPRSINLLGHDE